MKRLLLLLLLFLPAWGAAEEKAAMIEDVVNDHILPRIDGLATQTAALDAAAKADCDPGSENLKTAYGTAFDAWVSASHLRFGPSEAEDRAFSLAFWPDTRGMTPKALSGLIGAEDPAVGDETTFNTVSIAARGFYALEYLLYDPDFTDQGSAEYRCALIRAIAHDAALTTGMIRDDWHDSYAALLTGAGGNDIYRSDDEALRELFKALTTGLEFTADTRLGRPLGTFDRPRPTRAEARRSGRSLRHVSLSVASLEDLALRLAGDHADLRARLESEFTRALQLAERLEDPDFSGVADPQGRIRVEALQQAIAKIRGAVNEQLGPTLGVSAGFNSLDGD